MLMRSMTADEARQFSEKWLPAWTGNQPQKLAAFYTDNLFYSDPTLPNWQGSIHPAVSDLFPHHDVFADNLLWLRTLGFEAKSPDLRTSAVGNCCSAKCQCCNHPSQALSRRSPEPRG